MKRKLAAVSGALVLGAIVVAMIGMSSAAPEGAKAGSKAAPAAPEPEWRMNASVIEACSCTMFCQCYFNSKPGAHHEHGSADMKHYCKANNVYKVNTGNFGATKLDGAKFWIATDLGGDFSKGEMDWAVLYFDKTLSQPQRDGIATILTHLFPVTWKSLKTGEGDIVWNFDGKDEAHALLDGGKSGEVHLKGAAQRNDQAAPVVIKNLKYWGATSNDGFVLMPNIVEAWRKGEKAFEFKGTNGFMLTLDIDSKTAPPAAKANPSAF